MNDVTLTPVTQEAPKIEFPCNYLVKIIGDAVEEFHDRVLSIVEQHAHIPDLSSLIVRPSSKGTFVSVNVVIWATGIDQLNHLHIALREYKAVKMVI